MQFDHTAAEIRAVSHNWPVDGVDELLLKGGLSENIWNQLTALADLKSVTLILTSRRRLMDLRE